MTSTARRKPRSLRWMVVASILVVALWALIAIAIIAAVRSDDKKPTAPVVVERPDAAVVSDADAATAQAREFYGRLVERKFGEAAQLAIGDARTRLEALAARMRDEAAPDPMLAQIVDESTRGVLASFDVVELTPPISGGPLKLTARALVRLAETSRAVEIRFIMRKDKGQWRVDSYQPSATSP